MNGKTKTPKFDINLTDTEQNVLSNVLQHKTASQQVEIQRDQLVANINYLQNTK